VLLPIFIDRYGPTVVANHSDQSHQLSSQQISQSPHLRAIVQHVKQQAIQTSLVTGIGYCFLLIIIIVILHRSGHAQAKNQHLKGDQLVAAKMVKKAIVKAKLASPFVLGRERLPLIRFSETTHCLIHGTTGTGKSTAITSLLEQIRQQGDRALIYDKGCQFLQQFYQPNHDLLLNPLDSRSQAWDLWQECRHQADFDNIANAQIPLATGTQDPFWIQSARLLFATTAYTMRNDPNRSLQQLLQLLLTANLSELAHYLKGTPAANFVSEKMEKMAASIQWVLATYLNSLLTVKTEGQALSIRRWLQNDRSSQWLFITSIGDRHETLKPLISTWLDIAMNALLSRSTIQPQRCWIILDEVSSLQPLPYLHHALAEARKFGGCMVVGLQSYSQLCQLYGHDGARTLSSLLNTRLMFRQSDPEVAAWSAKNLGETQYLEAREGLSYGADTHRDGVSIQHIGQHQSVVSASDILRLENLQCYLRLPGHYPITQLHFDYHHRPNLQPAFLPREEVLTPPMIEAKLTTPCGTTTPEITSINVTSEPTANTIAPTAPTALSTPPSPPPTNINQTSLLD